MKFTRIIEGIELQGKARPRSTLIIPGAAKSRLSGLPRNLWPKSRVHMPDKYTKHVEELSKAFGNYQLGEVPHGMKVWVTFGMAKSWTKKKKAGLVGTLVITKPDADNALGTIMDAVFPEVFTGEGRQKKRVPGSGDSMINPATVEIRWWWYDSIRIEIEELPDNREVWPWLREEGAKTLFT